MEKEIFDLMCKLLNDGYEINLTRNSIKVSEEFKSCSREKYIKEDISDCFGTISYWEEGSLRVTRDRFKNVLEKLKVV